MLKKYYFDILNDYTFDAVRKDAIEKDEEEKMDYMFVIHMIRESDIQILPKTLKDLKKISI